MTLLTLFIIVFGCLLLQGFFSGSEMALISADRLLLKKQSEKGNRGAKLALELLKKPEHVLATTLVGTNLCVAFEAVAVTIYLLTNYGPGYELYSILVLSPLSLVFGEVLPKTIYQSYSEGMAPKIAPLIRYARLLFTPATWVLGRYTDWISKWLQPLEEAITGRQAVSHREELRYLLTYGKKETTLKTSERRMIRKIFDFSKAEVKNALIPLVNLQMIEDTTTSQEALALFEKNGHSRLPVYHERVDNVVGVLHIFDVFVEQDPQKKIIQLMQAPFYAPETQRLFDLQFTMQKRGIQMAIVVDEYGGAVGAVTLEDILEEIVGDIKDEYDSEAAAYRAINDKEFLIQGKMEIRAIIDDLKLNIPHGNYETLAGFLLQQFGRIPEEGDELYFSNMKVLIKKANNRVIQTVQITLLD